jgi:hypothetical protein
VINRLAEEAVGGWLALIWTSIGPSRGFSDRFRGRTLFSEQPYLSLAWILGGRDLMMVSTMLIFTFSDFPALSCVGCANSNSIQVKRRGFVFQNDLTV